MKKELDARASNIEERKQEAKNEGDKILGQPSTVDTNIEADQKLQDSEKYAHVLDGISDNINAMEKYKVDENTEKSEPKTSSWDVL